LTEEEMVLANAIAASEAAGNEIIKAGLVARLRDGMGALGRILKAVETFKGTVIHLESRQSREAGVQFDVLIKIEMTRSALLQLCRSLRQTMFLCSPRTRSVSLHHGSQSTLPSWTTATI
jgi:tyrosine 3-monooxygenase